MSYLFAKTDYKKHTYLAIPEVSVLKEGEGTPVDAHLEAMDVRSPPDVTVSAHTVASVVATRSTTAALLRQREKAMEQPENNQVHEPYPGSMSMGRNDQVQEHFARIQGPIFDRQGEEYRPPQPISPHPVSHDLEVGSAVQLVDPPGYGTIRWLGKFPGVIQDIAGVELVSCSVHCHYY